MYLFLFVFLFFVLAVIGIISSIVIFAMIKVGNLEIINIIEQENYKELSEEDIKSLKAATEEQ